MRSIRLMNDKIVISGVGFVLKDLPKIEDIAELYFNNTIEFDIFKTKDGASYPCLPIKDFDLGNYVKRCKNRRYLSKAGQFGLASAKQAIDDAKLGEEELAGVGVFSGLGPNMEEQYSDLDEKALWLLHFLPNTLNSVITNFFQIHGLANTFGNACAASTQAIAEAYEKVKSGTIDYALAGGCDSRINQYGIESYSSAGALYQADGQEINYEPLKSSPQGFIPGEGGAYLIIEKESTAKERGAKIYAEILGCGYSCDGYNMTAPQPDGKFAEQAIKQALKSAQIKAEEIDFVSCHGTGTLKNDKMEKVLLENIFGKDLPEVFTFKKVFGHLASACGAAETVASLGIFLQKDKKREIALVQNFGFGGQNTVLILKNMEN